MKDEFVKVQVPILNIDTWAKNDPVDMQIAITEATICFCILAERFGKGIEAELSEIETNGAMV